MIHNKNQIIAFGAKCSVLSLFKKGEVQLSHSMQVLQSTGTKHCATSFKKIEKLKILQRRFFFILFSIFISCNSKELIFDFYLNRKRNERWFAAFSCDLFGVVTILD